MKPAHSRSAPTVGAAGPIEFPVRPLRRSTNSTVATSANLGSNRQTLMILIQEIPPRRDFLETTLRVQRNDSLVAKQSVNELKSLAKH